MARLLNTKTNRRHNGAWGRYLGRLEKVTCGQPLRLPYCKDHESPMPEARNGAGDITSTLATMTKTVIDPVCGMKVNAGRTPLVFTYKGSRYYFCSKACRKAFKDNPVKFLASSNGRHRGVWGRYLHRLEKITGGRPMCCH
jgi:YHS domain-containing protein